MKTIFDHIEYVKGKPHHVRKMVVFGAAAAGTAVIALTWLSVSVGTGAFALKDTSFAQNAQNAENGVNSVVSKGDDKQLAGVGAASIFKEASAPARIEIIDVTSSVMSGEKAEQTVIPF